MSAKRQRRKAKQRRKRQLVESATTVEHTELKERGAQVSRSGSGSRRQITLIQSGWGSSGYYPRDVLERDGPKVWPAGTHMFLDHPTHTEEHERPERSVKDLAAVIASDPVMVGNELVAEADILENWAPVIDAVAPHIGVSIRAAGDVEEGSRDGRDGMIVERLTDGYSVDFVTEAGAGGRVGSLIENARAAAPLDEAAAHAELDVLMQESDLRERDVSPDERIALAKKGQAIPVRNDAGDIIGGRFPMANCQDVSNAAQSIGRGNAPNAQLQSFIKRAASKLSCPTPFQASRRQGDREESEVELEKQLSEAREKTRQHEDTIAKRDSTITELTESRDGEKTRADRAEDALLQERAERIIGEVMAYDGDDDERKLPGLPERALDRVKESALRGKLPLDEDGKLDKDKLAERVRKAAKDEHAYLNEGRTPASNVSGVGDPAGSNGGTGSEGESNNELAESFQRLGMSEAAAKVAAEGR